MQQAGKIQFRHGKTRQDSRFELAFEHLGLPQGNILLHGRCGQAEGLVKQLLGVPRFSGGGASITNSLCLSGHTTRSPGGLRFTGILVKNAVGLCCPTKRGVGFPKRCCSETLIMSVDQPRKGSVFARVRSKMEKTTQMQERKEMHNL
jgi:hypothetical protein